MNRHVIRYYFTEGFRGIFLHAFSSFAAVGVITACLLIMGSFTLVAVNIQSMVTELEQGSAIVVTIDESLSDALALSVGSRINEHDNVLLAEFVSRETAFEAWGEKYDPILLEGLDPGLFPHRYHIYLVDLQYAEETARDLALIPGITDVRSNRDVMSALLTARRIVNMVSTVLIAALLVVSLFIMQNTIKLATFERREEISIMRVVGATKGFVRWPFVVEGFVLGSVAGFLAYILQWSAYSRFAVPLFRQITDIGMVPFSELWLPVLIAFILVGFLVGMFGSVMTIRKYLRA